MEGTLILIFLVQGFVFGGFCSYLAEQKGKDKGTWYCLGFVFGIIGLLVIMGSTSEADSQSSQSKARKSVGKSQVQGSTAILEPGASTRMCPSCREIIQSQATVCPFCQRDVPQPKNCTLQGCDKIIDIDDIPYQGKDGQVFCSLGHREIAEKIAGRPQPSSTRDCANCGWKVLGIQTLSHALAATKRFRNPTDTYRQPRGSILRTLKSQ